jgi:hypothetical protein
MYKKAVVAYSEMLFQPEGTEEARKTSLWVTSARTENRIWDLPTTKECDFRGTFNIRIKGTRPN